jgi:hypothetical protein
LVVTVPAPASVAAVAAGSAVSTSTDPPTTSGRSHRTALAVAWALVGLPLAWGIYKTMALAAQLFTR